MPTTTNYGFYSPPLTGVTPDVPRDTKTLADGVDAALKAEENARIAATARFSSAVACTTSYTTTTTTADVTGMTTNVTVTGTANAFLVTISLDVNILTTGGGTLIATLVVNGTTQSAQALLVNTATGRQPVTQTWLITGLAAGTPTFKVQASGTVASVYRINAQHSTLTVAQIAV